MFLVNFDGMGHADIASPHWLFKVLQISNMNLDYLLTGGFPKTVPSGKLLKFSQIEISRLVLFLP